MQDLTLTYRCHPIQARKRNWQDTYTADEGREVRKAQTNIYRTRTEKYVEMTKADARQEVSAKR